MAATTEERVEQVIHEKGGRRLDADWKSVEAKIHIECEKGHQWEVKAASILYLGTWCRECQRDNRRLGIEGAQAIAAERGGQCMARQYKNSHEAMPWRCREGHDFIRTLQGVKRGAWCPSCGRAPDEVSRRTGFDVAIAFAAAEGGRHLGDCDSSGKSTHWQCKEGHQFTATGKTLARRPYFCPECAGKTPTTIETVREVCAGRGGRCLSSEYVSLSARMEFECARGHRWNAKWRNVGGHGSWCPTCARTRGDMTLLTAIAEHYGGEVLSSKYFNSRNKYQWRCGDGHLFEAVPARAKKNWCPECPTKHDPVEKSAHQLIAEHHGGECLDAGRGAWRCELGHRFQASLSLAGIVWCPTCRNGYGKNDRAQGKHMPLPVGVKRTPASATRSR